MNWKKYLNEYNYLIESSYDTILKTINQLKKSNNSHDEIKKLTSNLVTIIKKLSSEISLIMYKNKTVSPKKIIELSKDSNLILKNIQYISMNLTKKRHTTSNYWYIKPLQDFSKYLESIKKSTYKVGDDTSLGKIKDMTDIQYLINGQWYAKSIIDKKG